MTDKRKAVEKIVERLYKHQARTGSQPDGKTVRRFEREAQAAAERVENKTRGK